MKYNAIDQEFRSILEDAAHRNRYVKLQYFTDLREFVTTMAVVKDLFTHDNEEYLLLHTDEKIRLDKITKIDDHAAPGYTDIYDFTCDC